jgi:hypothetical protein
MRVSTFAIAGHTSQPAGPHTHMRREPVFEPRLTGLTELHRPVMSFNEQRFTSVILKQQLNSSFWHILFSNKENIPWNKSYSALTIEYAFTLKGEGALECLL